MELPLSDLRVLGEYTTPAGPFTEDYFLVFIAGAENIYEGPVASKGCQSLLVELSRKLGNTEIEFGLANETTYRSRVMWPSELVDSEMYKFVETPSTGLRAWLARMGIGGAVQAELSPEVRERVG